MITTKHSTKDTWMKTKPVKQLHYVCRTTDSVKTLPWTKNRENNVSTLFYADKVSALMVLRDRVQERANHYTCRLMEIEIEIAKEKQRVNSEKAKP